ncbi:rhodanese-like domain-containing protein [Clostridium beijerinckii]|nr:rhodanese-like domain-containing protein [Clostridium beijerinckii]
MFGFSKGNDGKVININDIDNLIGKVELIDIREDYEYKGGSIKSSKNIPMGELLNEPDKYYIMCQSGGRSARACSSLTSEGFKVINVSGGMGSYVGTQRK